MKQESPFFLSKAILSISKEAQGKSANLFKDCLVRLKSELLQPDPVRLKEIC